MNYKELLADFYLQLEPSFSSLGCVKEDSESDSILDFSYAINDDANGLVSLINSTDNGIHIMLMVEIVLDEVESLALQLTEDNFRGVRRTAYCKLPWLVSGEHMLGWRISGKKDFPKQSKAIVNIVSKYAIKFIQKFADINKLADYYLGNQKNKANANKYSFLGSGLGLFSDNKRLEFHSMAIKVPIILCLVGKKAEAKNMLETHLNALEKDRDYYEKFANNLKQWGKL